VTLESEIDLWWSRLGKERPLTGRECVQLQALLMKIKTVLKEDRK